MSIYAQWVLVLFSVGISVILILGLAKIHKVSLKALNEAEKMRTELHQHADPLEGVNVVIQEIQTDIQAIKRAVGTYPIQKGDHNNAKH